MTFWRTNATIWELSIKLEADSPDWRTTDLCCCTKTARVNCVQGPCYTQVTGFFVFCFLHLMLTDGHSWWHSLHKHLVGCKYGRRVVMWDDKLSKSGRRRKRQDTTEAQPEIHGGSKCSVYWAVCHPRLHHLTHLSVLLFVLQICVSQLTLCPWQKVKKKKTTQTEVHPMLKQLCLQPLRTDLGFYCTTYLNDHTNWGFITIRNDAIRVTLVQLPIMPLVLVEYVPTMQFLGCCLRNVDPGLFFFFNVPRVEQTDGQQRHITIYSCV